jgi:hypothetical protein
MGVPLRVAEVVDGHCQRHLRRYRRGAANDCPSGGYHNAIVQVGEVTDRADAVGDNWPHDDPRWPKACGCGYQFTDDDHWSRNDCRIVRLPDGTEITWWGSFGSVAPPGTMIRASWYDEFSQHPDGVESWLISLPDGGEWITSQRATGGGYWTVTGTVPLITASPSVWHNSPKGWHGWVRNGELVDALCRR